MNQFVKSPRGGEYLIRSHAEPGNAATRSATVLSIIRFSLSSPQRAQRATEGNLIDSNWSCGMLTDVWLGKHCLKQLLANGTPELPTADGCYLYRLAR